ncbi:MAG: hypothetical protein ACREX3_11700 [Gammaproteobacteria bacterium]
MTADGSEKKVLAVSRISSILVHWLLHGQVLAANEVSVAPSRFPERGNWYGKAEAKDKEG